ncbi:MAG: two-component regulator propeller domain-containing protein [Salinivirgaceae bacterium]|nr:two-component regulator propeller domain-containing protein [Salinivirgaceae bacterium]MDY0279787.1 two-component regulator propeller domain-containing protein [Salinivirgaceae bacterium]
MRLLFLSIILIPLFGFAQRVSVFSVDEGLSQSVVNSLHVDNYGLVWVGTQNGLNCYNGYRFKHYNYRYSDPASLIDGFISSIASDTSGCIWVGTRLGVNIIDHNKEYIEAITMEKGRFLLPESRVIGLIIDSKNVAWIQTYSYITKFDISNNTSKNFHFDSDNSIIDQTKLALNGAGDLIFVSSDSLRVIKNDKVISIKLNQLNDRKVINVEVLEDNRVVVLLKGAHIVISADFKDQTAYKNNESIDFLHKRDGILYGISGTGVSIFMNNDFTPYSQTEDVKARALKIGILSAFLDNNKTMWIGTDGGGLVQFDMRPSDIKTIIPTVEFEDVVFDNQTMALKIDDNRIIAGGYSFGLMTYDLDSTNYSYINIDQVSNGLYSNRVTYITELDSNIWVFTYSGHFFLDHQNNLIDPLTLYPYLGEIVEFKDFSLYRTLSIGDDFYLATDLGLYHIDKINKQSGFVKEIDSFLKIGQKHVIDIVGNDTILYLAVTQGLLRYDLRNKEIKYLQIGDDHRQGININTIYILHIDSNGRMWIGTTSGLFYFDHAFKIPEQFIKVEELQSKVIFSIEEDSMGRLWLGTDFGLYSYSPKDSITMQFEKEDGLNSMEFNLGASIQFSDGRLIFGTQGGISSFDPAKIQKSKFDPKMVFSGVEITGKSGIRKIDETDIESITIHPSEFMVKISFSSVDLTSPGKNRYRYRFDNEEWVDIGNQNFVSFLNLSAGKYNLYINGSNSDQIWSTNVRQIKLIVTPAWYVTYWAYIVYGLIVLLLFWRFFEIRTRKLRRINMILREKEGAAKEVARQKDTLAILNRNMTDSMRYAHRIQRALFPDELKVRAIFPDSFVLYKPKDIVSGDFYWVHDFGDNRFCIAAVDCTGHGVPGALMSVIGVKLLQEIIVQNSMDRPGDILQMLDFKVCSLFKNHHEEYFLAEGMDLSLCVFDKNVRTVQYAGAINSLYHVKAGVLREIKADRMPVGISDVTNGYRFTNHELTYDIDDVFYMFTDGYVDQFGGVDEQKFKKARFKEFLSNFKSDNMDLQQAMLENNFERWRGENEQIDDILVIGLRMS